MENVKALFDGVLKDIYGILYVYNSKYYLIYTEKELDEAGYVISYICQIGKETKNTENGPIDTGYMIGVEITDPTEQSIAQQTVSYVVEDKKNNTVNPQIQYLPVSMLSNLKIIGKKRFRLLKSIMVDSFKLVFDESVNVENTIPAAEVQQPVENTVVPQTENIGNSVVSEGETVIIDYRSKFFEEEQKNEELKLEIEELKKKLNDIKNIIEYVKE